MNEGKPKTQLMAREKKHESKLTRDKKRFFLLLLLLWLAVSAEQRPIGRCYLLPETIINVQVRYESIINKP